MKTHTKNYKSAISTFGRELDSKITILNSDLVLGKEDLYSVNIITNTDLLKSVMKEVDFESKKQIGIGQEINVKSGVKVNGEYEYIDYGNYFVYKSEYRAETDSYSHICYDKMLYTMIDYVPLDITYPINLREYINAIATKCGLEFANIVGTFANYDTPINKDNFSNGNYTFRDVLDYVAELVGGWFCINDDDKLEIRYPSQAKNYESDSGKEINFYTEVEDKIKKLTIYGNSIQETRSGKNLFNKSITPIIASGGQTITELDTGVKISCTNSSSSNVVKYALYKLIDLTNYVGKVARIKCDFSKSNEILAPRYCIGLCDVDGYNRKQKSVCITSGKTVSFTVPTLDSTSIYLCVWLYCTYNSPIEKGDYVDFTNLIITVDNSDMTYEPYGISPSPDYPSEIESVGTYFSFDEETGKYGIEVKNTGKNLLENTGVSNTSNGVTFTVNDDKTILVNGNNDGTANSSFIINNYSLKAGTYILNGCPSGGSSTTYSLAIQKTSGWSVLGLDTGSGSKQFTIDEATNIQVAIFIQKGQTISNLLFKPMIRLSSIIDDTYEPYKSVSSLFVLDQPLRSLPNGVKDIAYIKNNILYVDRKVGSIVLNGNEGWALRNVNSDTGIATYSVSGVLDYYKNSDDVSALSSHFKYLGTINAVILMYSKEIGITLYYNESITNLQTIIYINSNITTLSDFKTWLSTHNTQVDYELAEPYTEEIGEVEMPSAFKGNNNITLSANINTNIDITYTKEYEEVDREFLKDVNVSFSKKYGPVNSVVFSRGGGSDNIYRKDYDSISANGLTEIKITDNPFLEDDERENFIQSVFDKLNGLEFYIMDVASTGITYLELGDLYYFNMSENKPSLKAGLVQAGLRKAQGSSLGKYICLMLNDKIDITQGLSESIYVDEPDITETDYKTASITDKSIKNAIIQTNKNSAEILLKVNSDEVVSAINLSPEKIKISSAKLDIDAIATFTNSKLAQAGSTVINGANITTGSINCDRLNGGTINGQAIRGGSISIQTGNYYFNMGTSTSNPNCSGLNVGGYGIKAYSDITATGFAITDSDTGKSQPVNIYDGHGHVHYLTFTGGILTKWEYK